VVDSPITHSRYAALRLKDAVVDHLREHTRSRPGIDRRAPDVWLALHIRKDRATVSLDTSGGSLHRRGYRKESVQAPLQETLAAAIIRLAEWDGSPPLYDPMCGSGTLLCEALMTACRIPAGYLRERFGFENLPDFNPQTWAALRHEQRGRIRELPEGLISGSDLNPRAVAAAEANLRSLPQGNGVSVRARDFRQIPDLRDRVILCNPPYGIRMGKKREAARIYKDLGDFLKQRCRGSRAYIYFGDRELISRVGLRPSWKRRLFNGGLEGRLALFEIY
jgi:putative N6-adenine-specific DNA methylase